MAGRVNIDMLAGPSELCVLCDVQADPITIAADLLAQAEHDTDAVPMLVVVASGAKEAEGLLSRVEAELAKQLAALPSPNRETATASLKNNGFACVCHDMDTAISVCDRIAPEHLELLIKVEH